MKTKNLFSVAIRLLFIPVLTASAVANDLETRRAQVRQEAQDSYIQIEQALHGILQKANWNQRPDDAEILKAAELLETNRRNAVTYETPQKAGYMLLQSWVSYYQNEPVSNLNWAVRACRENPANGDAWVSQTLFSLIYNRRPVEPQPARPQRPQPTRQRPGAQPTEMIAASAAPPFGHPGTLDVDLNHLRRDFLRERFVRQEYQTIDGQKIVYDPATDILCLLVWRGEEAVDPNTPGAPKPQDGPLARDRAATPVETTAIPAEYSLENQQAYFEIIRQMLSDKKEVKFAEINVNSPAVAEQLLRDHKPVAPLVTAAHPHSGAIPFARLDVSVPFMAIIEKDGQVKYAGVADGFVPAFILTHLTGVPIDLQIFQPVEGPSEHPYQYDRMSPTPRQARTAADPNRPAGPDEINPRLRPTVQPPAETAAPQYRQLPDHQKLDAEKRLAAARDFFMNAPRLRVITYKNGIDMCRAIIRDYPDTEYADQARQLLQKIPERQRELYNVTPEELGRR